MNTKDIKALLNTKDYEFLKTHDKLGDNICYLTLGGSLAYGTNLPDKGDVDIRGITVESKKDLAKSLLEMEHFEQVSENNTDTVIYGFNKIVKLLLSCNPNTIEMLGTKPEHIFYMNDIGKMLRDNSDLFLSQRAIGSFGGYAGQQLNRMLNALARDRIDEIEKEEHILRSVKSAMLSINSRYSAIETGNIDLFIGKSKKENLETEIFANINLANYPLRDFNGILNELGSIVRVYGKLNHRNNKKDDNHLNKHAMHLIRLYLMAIDILDKGEIITYREKDKDLLLDIRKGKYMNEDGTYKKEFFEMQEELENQFKKVAQTTALPKLPDYDKVLSLTTDINEMIMSGVNLNLKTENIKVDLSDDILR